MLQVIRYQLNLKFMLEISETLNGNKDSQTYEARASHKDYYNLESDYRQFEARISETTFFFSAAQNNSSRWNYKNKTENLNMLGRSLITNPGQILCCHEPVAHTANNVRNCCLSLYAEVFVQRMLNNWQRSHYSPWDIRCIGWMNCRWKNTLKNSH